MGTKQEMSFDSAMEKVKQPNEGAKVDESTSTPQQQLEDPLSLRNLSKFMIPPLGVSSYNQTQLESKGWVITPMDSTYRYVTIISFIYFGGPCEKLLVHEKLASVLLLLHMHAHFHVVLVRSTKEVLALRY